MQKVKKNQILVFKTQNVFFQIKPNTFFVFTILRIFYKIVL